MLDGIISQLTAIFLHGWEDVPEPEAKAADSPNKATTPVAAGSYEKSTPSPSPRERISIPTLWQDPIRPRQGLRAGDRVHVAIRENGDEKTIHNCILLGKSGPDGNYRSALQRYGTYYMAVDPSGRYLEVGPSDLEIPSFLDNSWLLQPSLPQQMARFNMGNDKYWVSVTDFGPHQSYQERIPVEFKPGEEVYFPTRYLTSFSDNSSEAIYAKVLFPERVHRDENGDIYITVEEEKRDHDGRPYKIPVRVPLYELRDISERPGLIWSKVHQSS